MDDIEFKDDKDSKDWETRLAEHATQLEKASEEKLAELEKHTPTVMKIEELNTKNKLLNKQLAEVEKFEAKQADYQLITLKEVYDIEYPAENFLIDKILLERGFSMLVGDTGTGKSFLSLYMAKCLVTGEKFLDQFEVKSKVPLLIIDKENGLRRAKQRLQSLGCPSTDQIFFLKYPEKFSLDNTEFLTALHDLIIEHQIKVVILDSFVDVILGNENDAGHISDVYGALRQISNEVSWWMLHHESKPLVHSTRTAVQRTRGSSNIAAQLDNQFYIEATSKPGTINIEQSKARDFEPLKKSGVEFITDDEGNLSGFKYLGEIIEEASKTEEAKQLVMAALSVNNKMSRQELFDEVSGKVGRDSIDKACKELELDKVISSIKEGRFKYFQLLDATYLPDSCQDVPDQDDEKISLF